MSEFVKVARKDEVPEDTGKRVEVNGREIALFKKDGRVYAIDHVCPHAGGPLAEGALNGGMAMCPWHGWEFSITTGECAFNSAIRVETFSVREEDGDVYVKA